ncbi:LPD7 domain-containing protein [Azospirillum sp.]|uniref:LPD7 domain-containing protein n=1 Tax=Azospirillum sp. TaxID=34012 RepID=UPI002D26E4E1|nr:LPD7 domain-containing protein [Azospirillum sp.]HYD70739.1 LPD7 domain-containing protein [Azospirillum sp.]
MSLADWLPDSMRPANSIALRPVADPPRGPGVHGASPPPGAGASRGTSQAPAAGDGGPAPAPRSRPAARTAPDPLAHAYYVEDADGERRYYDDHRGQSLALRATERTISTRREDRKTIAAMIVLAAARGWTAVEIKGTAAFRQEAWIAAQVHGLEAHGHRPTALDRQEAERRRAERGAPNGPRPATVAAPAPAETGPPAPAPPPAPDRTAPPPRTAGGPVPDGNGNALQAAHRALSADGRLVLAALSETIDRRMSRIAGAAKADLKRFVATELLKKERAEGPVVLSATQKRAVLAPEPARTAPDGAGPARRAEPEAPRRSR